MSERKSEISVLLEEEIEKMRQKTDKKFEDLMKFVLLMNHAMEIDFASLYNLLSLALPKTPETFIVILRNARETINKLEQLDIEES